MKHNATQREQRLSDLRSQLEALLRAIEQEKERSSTPRLPSDPATRMTLIQHQARALRWLAAQEEHKALVAQALEATARAH